MNEAIVLVLAFTGSLLSIIPALYVLHLSSRWQFKFLTGKWEIVHRASEGRQSIDFEISGLRETSLHATIITHKFLGNALHAKSKAIIVSKSEKRIYMILETLDRDAKSPTKRIFFSLIEFSLSYNDGHGFFVFPLDSKLYTTIDFVMRRPPDSHGAHGPRGPAPP